MKRNKILGFLTLILSIIKFNFRIIFANRFVWFMLGSVAFYIILSLNIVLTENTMRIEDMYGILLFSGILIVFYPTVFGIQNDQDARTIEILFGIPNYRYKVWLVRSLMIFLLAFLMVFFYASLTSYLIVRFNIFDMASQVMFPILFLGTMAFMLSTLIRNGNGTAVTMIVFGIIFMILADPLEKSRWNVFLNPFAVPSNVSDIAWQSISFDNRIFMTTGIILFLLYALFNLQKREKFM